jgi:hypothetical protein
MQTTLNERPVSAVILGATADALTRAAGAQAQITYAAGVQHCISGVAWSYSAAPPAAA